MNTVFSLLDVFSIKEIAASHADYAISPIPGPKTRGYSSIWTKIFGIRVVPHLGIQTTSLGGAMDKPLVQRTWGLLGGDKCYGPNFSFTEYMKAKSYIAGAVVHFALAFGSLCLAFPFVRNIIRSRVFQPGDGESREDGKKNRLEYRGIASPDVKDPKAPSAFCKASYEGAIYGREYPQVFWK